MDLNTIWFLLVGIFVIVYAVLDGFDLGVGILYFFLAKTPEEKMLLTHSIGPVWDGNEVWLITGGALLFAAFPLVYASAFSAFYLALFLVLFGLIARCISIEYKKQAPNKRVRGILEWAFVIGSLVPALLYGVAMGNVAKGLPLDIAQNYAGTFWELLNPYALLFGLVGLTGIILQGITYTIMKTDGLVARRAERMALNVWGGFIILYLLGTLYSALIAPQLFANYLHYPILFAIPVVSWAAMALTGRMLLRKRTLGGFLASSVSFATTILTLAIGLFPNLLPASEPSRSLTIYNASSSPLTLKVMLIIVLCGLPFVLLYTVYVYRVFHGKAKVHEGY